MVEATITAANEEDLPAVFWDSLPSNKDNADLAAINALIEEQTPAERAESHKTRGNEALKTGLKLRKKFYFREASIAYTKGLEEHCGSRSIDAILLSNRAQVHLILGNDRNALEDGLAAMNLDDSNLKVQKCRRSCLGKQCATAAVTHQQPRHTILPSDQHCEGHVMQACYRAAKAAYNLKQYSKAMELAAQGLDKNAEAHELELLQQNAQKNLEAEEQQELERAATQKAKRGPAQQLATALISLRNWQIGKPQLSIGDRKPEVDADGLVHWPVMFVYPETMQTDAVEDFLEADSLQLHLDVMFAPDAPPLHWDEERHYTRNRVELYYLSHAARPLHLDQLTEVLYGGWPQDLKDVAPQRYGPQASKWCKVDESRLLGELLSQPDYVIPGIPVFFIVSKGTDYRERFLSDEIPLF